MSSRKSLAVYSLRILPVVAKGSGRGQFYRRGGSNDPTLYKPTDAIRLTGIYEVIHDRGHRETHEVVMHARDLFPACDTCDMRVRFRLLRTAPYIFDDEDFEREE
jgi:hypothetical protein